MITLKKILVATDFGEAADAALSYGRALAARFGASLDLLHVTQNVFLVMGGDAYVGVAPDLQRDIDEAARQKLQERLLENDPDPDGRPRKAVVLTSNMPAYAIADYAHDAGIDLIVMGTHGRGALAHVMMGSVAEKVVRIAPCPVLTVHHPEHEFVLPDALEAVQHA